jgi:hypothetical protein
MTSASRLWIRLSSFSSLGDSILMKRFSTEPSVKTSTASIWPGRVGMNRSCESARSSALGAATTAAAPESSERSFTVSRSGSFATA